MDEPLTEKIGAYARLRQLRMGRKLGSGNEPTVIAAGLLGSSNEIAIKFHLQQSGYLHEKAVYERLPAKGIVRVLGFNVPEFIAADDEWLVLQMTIVPKPFVLNFGRARLDEKPYFSDEIWEDWREQKMEMFEQRRIVEEIIFELQLLGIHLMASIPEISRSSTRIRFPSRRP